MPMLHLSPSFLYDAYMIFPYKQPARYIFEENIYFNRKQICNMLGISNSSLSKQLRRILEIPGCQAESFRARLNRGRHRHTMLTHYNLNTVAALAYRINNESCKKFLNNYHRTIYSLHIRISGANYYIPSVLTEEEFAYYAQNHCLPYNLNHEDG